MKQHHEAVAQAARPVPSRGGRRYGAHSNVVIAERLREAGELLEAQGANPFRVAAYRRAADTVAELDTQVRTLVEERGMQALMALPTIGQGIAAAIVEMVALGRWSQLERWRGESDPIQRLCNVPGIGPRLAERIHDELHIDTLESLEVAAHDGRLEQVRGVGPRRAAALRATLAGLLGTRRGTDPVHVDGDAPRPPVSVILDVDREYRRRAAAGDLHKVTPRRFNPGAERWLPVLHTERGAWHFTALYSNTARAHDFGRTHDWVIIYFYDGDHRERQATVVTETHGTLVERRVVRGREHECAEYYAIAKTG